MNKKVSVVSLGCDKNRVDTETMLYNLASGGYEIINDFNEAEIIIVNTCAFIESARKEAIETILNAVNYKSNKCEKLIVTGCLPQKYKREIAGDLPEVDAFLGTEDYATICDTIQSLYVEFKSEKSSGLISQKNSSETNENLAENCACDSLVKVKINDYAKRILTTSAHVAYLKIADGCNNHCTFCTIPSIRGAYRSRTIESLVLEAKKLVDDGVKELILVAQDVTRYGIDLYDKLALVDLLHALSELDVVWIRLMYCYDDLVTDELISEIDNNPKIAKYIDIPIQHASDKILKFMNRRSSNSGLRALMCKLRSTRNEIAVRTTVMVGFPGETEEDFNELVEFLKEFKPAHVGVFAYSKEADTPSALLKGHLSKKIKAARVKTIGELHLQNCKERNNKFIGQTIRVLYEDIDYKKNLFVGRAEFSAPDIDTFVYFKADFADVGNFYDITITHANTYDLFGWCGTALPTL